MRIVLALGLLAFAGALTILFAQQQPGQLPPQQPGQLAPKQPGQLPPQQPSPPPADSDQLAQGDSAQFRISTLNILVPVTVTDKTTHKFVNGLTPLDFELYDNDKRQRITEDIAAHPISLVMVVQSNAAMEKILPNVRKVGSLLNGLVLGEFGEIAIIGFDHRIQTLSPFTADPEKITDALQKLKPGSNSSRLNDAAMEGVNLLKTRPNTRKRIMLIVSESRDYGSEIHVREVLSAMEFANVLSYSIDVSHLITSFTAPVQPNRPNPIPVEGRRMPNGDPATPTTDAQLNVGNWVPAIKEIFTQVKGIFVKNPLEVFTQYTGGREYSFMTQRAFEQAVSDIGEELHSQYLLTYSPNNQNEPGFHEIKVRVLKPDLEVRKRDGYYIAGAPQ